MKLQALKEKKESAGIENEEYDDQVEETKEDLYPISEEGISAYQSQYTNNRAPMIIINEESPDNLNC